MGRWEPNGKARLREAAMDLFLQHGYEQTTVAEIADRAGLTSRTFFRYFSDKREVLFGGSEALQAAMVVAVDDAPLNATPLDVIALALDAAADLIGGRRAFSQHRHEVINANPALRERELIKMATLSAALADALRARGAGTPANLVAETGVAVFRVAFERWVTEPVERTLHDVMRECFRQLRELS